MAFQAASSASLEYRFGSARLHELQSGLNEFDRVAFGQFTQPLSHLVGRSAHHDDGNLVVAAADGRQKSVPPRRLRPPQVGGLRKRRR